MARIRSLAGGLAVAAAVAWAPTPAQAASNDINAYRVEATGKNLRALAEAGFDVTEGRDLKKGTIEVYGTTGQVRGLKLGAREVLENGRSPADRSRRAIGGRASTRAADPTDGASDAPYTVWRKYDAVAGDGREQYTEFYDRVLREHPNLVRRRVVGKTRLGRDIVALQLTRGATGANIQGRPAVLYNAMQHAREWLAGETCKRTLSYFLDNYGKSTSAGREVTPLVDDNELWFVCVNNPDGYEYTFTPGNRLWRKNLRDNDDDGRIAPGDGVDPNRNFASNWGRDDEGSSPVPSSETYRGPSAGSEPETKAMEALFAEIGPVFQKNDHTAAELLLYPQGVQQDTPSADDEIFRALAGDPFKPAIPGFVPEPLAALYITNGEFTDWAYDHERTLAFATEGTAAEDPGVSVFEYPDSPLQVRQEFRRHLPFALDLAKSAERPDEPVSHLGNKAADFVVDSFAESRGDPQPIGATVKRALGDVDLKYKVNDGPVVTVATRPYAGGERYFRDPGREYRRIRGTVVDTRRGDRVEAWFAGGGRESRHFDYRVADDSPNPVLLLSDEDWSGVMPNASPLGGPRRLDDYRRALDAAGIKYDVYDTSRDRRAPHALGVLAHYSHVVWYSGDDYLPREPGQPAGSGITKLAVDTQNAVRSFINDGGRLFYTGKNAGRPFSEGFAFNPFQYEEREFCNTSDRCLAAQDDFAQYYLGAYRAVFGSGADAQGEPFDVLGTARPFDGVGEFGFNGADSANNQHADAAIGDKTSTFTYAITSSVLDPARYPLFRDSRAVAKWRRPYAGPFQPIDGSWFMSAGTDDLTYKRLLKGFDLTGKTGATLKFKTSYDLEPSFDYVFVEIHTKGQDDWTTLKADDGANSQDTGLSCLGSPNGSNWQADHPFLAHYQTRTADGCSSTGTTGEWWAATGNSGGWKDWSLPIPDKFQGKEVEISITGASDGGVQHLGLFVDQAQMDTAQGPVGGQGAAASFESDLNGWTTPGPPPGTKSPITGWERRQQSPFVEGPVVTTDDTVYTGFSFEAITGLATRKKFLDAVFAHLGAPRKPTIPSSPPKASGPGRPGQPPSKKRIRIAFGKQRLKTVLRRGLTVKVTGPANLRFGAQAKADRATKRTYRLRSARLGRTSATLSRSGRRTVRIRFAKSAVRRLRKARRIRLTVTVTAASSKPVRRTLRLR